MEEAARNWPRKFRAMRRIEAKEGNEKAARKINRQLRAKTERQREEHEEMMAWFSCSLIVKVIRARGEGT